jgi:hypothetical protein
MKKILLLLLLPFLSIGQVSNGTETEFEALKTTSSQTVTSPTYLVTQGVDGTMGKIVPSNMPISTATQTALDLKKSKTSTAVTSDFTLTNNGTTFSLSSLTGIIANNSTIPTTITNVSFAGASNVTPLYLRAIIYINSSGSLIQFNGASGDLTPEQKRDNLFIGIVVYIGGNVVAIQKIPSIDYDADGRLETLQESLGVINRDGNVIGANGANLQFNKGAGHTQRSMSNYFMDRKVPDVTTDAAITPVPSGVNLIGYRNGSGGWTYEAYSGSITPQFWDNGTGTKATVANNKFTTQRIYFFNGTNTFVIYLGQAEYVALAAAEAAVNNADRVVDPATSPASLRSNLIVEKSCTALNNTSLAKFVEGPKISGGSSGGASGSQSLQGAYSNSVSPQITTTTALGSVDFKRGSTSDNDSVIRVLNGAGTQTYSVAGSGALTALSYNGYAPENVANKNVANGYAPLDGTIKVPTSNLNQSTETQIGVVELATAAETTTGTDNTRSVTPLGLANATNVIHTTGNETKTGMLSISPSVSSANALIASSGSGTGGTFTSTSAEGLVASSVSGKGAIINTNSGSTIVDFQANSVTKAAVLFGGGYIGTSYTANDTGASAIKLNLNSTASGATNNYAQFITPSDGGKGLFTGVNTTARRFYFRLNDSNDYGYSWQNSSGGSLLDISNSGVLKSSNLSGTGQRSADVLADGTFVAGSVQPLKYTALISQSGTAAPTATVFENTLGGTVVWTRTGVGTYLGTLVGAFVANKTFVVASAFSFNTTWATHISRAGTDTVNIKTFVVSSGAGADSVLSDTSIKIEVYP